MNRPSSGCEPPASLDAGFTLVEVLIALTILAVGLLAVAGMQITGLQSNRYAMTLTEGTTLARNRMEMLMGLSFDDPRLAPSGGAPHTDEQAPEGFTVEWEVVPDSPVANAKLVVLTSAWRTRFGTRRSVRLTGVKNDFRAP